MTSATGNRQQGQGFTLLELLLVTAIIGILVGMVTPYLRSGYSHMELRDSARTLLALMKHAQQRAIFEVRRYRISFDAVSRSRWGTGNKLNTYWLEKYDEDRYEPVSSALGDKKHLSGDVIIARLEAGDREVRSITFYPSGRVDAVELDLAWGKEVIRLRTLPKIQEVPPKDE